MSPIASTIAPTSFARPRRRFFETPDFETPRQTAIEELVSELDFSSPTLSYRLRRAEAQLANGFID